MFGGTPAPALLAGMVGVVPYAIASVATLLLTWDINAATHQAHTLKGMTASSGTSIPNVVDTSILSGSPDCATLARYLATPSDRVWGCSALFSRGDTLGFGICRNGRPSCTFLRSEGNSRASEDTFWASWRRL